MDNIFKVEPRQWSFSADWSDTWSPQFFTSLSQDGQFTLAPDGLPYQRQVEPPVSSSSSTSIMVPRIKRPRTSEHSIPQGRTKSSPYAQALPIDSQFEARDSGQIPIQASPPYPQTETFAPFRAKPISKQAQSPYLQRGLPPSTTGDANSSIAMNGPWDDLERPNPPATSYHTSTAPSSRQPYNSNTNNTNINNRDRRSHSDSHTHSWKAAHNLVERNYRDRLNDQISELSNLLFDNTAGTKGSKPPKSLVISRAKDRLRELTAQNKELLSEVEKLKQHIAVLDHVARTAGNADTPLSERSAEGGGG